MFHNPSIPYFNPGIEILSNFNIILSFTQHRQALLSLWLLHEKSLGDTSKFGPYLDSLPTHYTNPYFCSAKEKLCLPQSLSEKVTQQEDVVIKNYQQLLGLTKQLSWVLTPSMVEFSWAWFTVNTRAVYLDSDPRWPQRCSTHSPSPTDDHLGEELEKRHILKVLMFCSLGAIPGPSEPYQ